MADSSVQVDTPTTVIAFTPVELELLRAALRLLMSTLGRDEADELVEVRDLLRKIER